LSIKESSHQSFREVSETIPGLKSQVKRGVSLRRKNPPMRAGSVRRSWPELVALRAILLNVLFKQANAQTLTADATADRPGRLIPLIPFYAEIQRIRKTIETVAEDRIRL